MAKDNAAILQKIRISGNLILKSPLLIGSGEHRENSMHEIDTYILRNQDDRPFIPGTSLAGVLRNAMMGADASDTEKTVGELLFGKIDKDKKSDTGWQSAISIDDLILDNAEIVQRDGVSIDSYTHTAIDKKKYDYEAVERGAKGTFQAVVSLRKNQEDRFEEIHAALGSLVGTLKAGIRIGALTTKGFGHVQVSDAKAELYDFRYPEDVQAWLLQESSNRPIADMVEVGVPRSNTLYIDGEFSLRSALIIRDYDTDETQEHGEGDIAAVQKQSNREYVIPGTSLKGVLRHQAERIVRLSGQEERLADGLNELMGYAEEDTKEKQKSRFYVDEAYLKQGVAEKEQSRNRIDRFTGGTVETALFTTKPIWQMEPHKPTVHIHYEIPECKPWEAGLALFLLRDLWQGNVALGGEKSIGRGVLEGVQAVIVFEGNTYELGANGKVQQGSWQQLDDYAKAFINQ